VVFSNPFAKNFNRSLSTISPENKLNGGYYNYPATQAALSAWEWKNW
jgi:hypothetical protein